MLDIKGKWAFITGASRGLGSELALFMAEKGCNLILHSRKMSNISEIESKVKALGVKTYCFEAELSDMKAIDKMLEGIDQLDLDVGIVFNNAGIQIAYRTDFYKTPVSDFEESFKVNTIAPAKICYHFLPKMIDKKFGRIINTTSGIENQPEQAGYSASKAGLDKITKDLGYKIQESNVLINLVDPGWCRTDLGGPTAPNDVKSALPGISLGAFVDDGKSGRIIRAQEYSGLDLDEAINKLQNEK